MATLIMLLFINLNFLIFARGSHHWIVTETGRIEPKMDSAFPVRRPYDLISVLEQEQRVEEVTEMHKRLLSFKLSLDEQWSAIELETEFEDRLYATDPNCMYADHPLSRYRLNPVFIDFPAKDRPKLPRHRLNEKPPDCKKAYQLDFSLLTFPHLKTLRDRENVSRVLDEVETDAQLGVDVAAMLAANSSDWTAYNLAVHYWQLHSNASQAIECARRAVYFSPREYRYLVLFNLGTLLQAVHSLEEAAIVLHMAVDLDRGQYRSHVALGHVYSYLGDYPRAAGCYENALSLRPDLILLAKQRAAVLCHQRLISGLWAIDSALKKIVEELQEYSQLQERWVLTHTQIGLERACGFTVTPPADNLRSLWKAVEHQAFLLSERLTLTKPVPVHMAQPGGALNPVGQCAEPAEPPQNWQTFEVQEDCGPDCSTSSEGEPNLEENEILRKKVSEFHSFMTEMASRSDITPQVLKEKIIEKLLNLEETYEKKKGNAYLEILRKCVSMLDEDEEVLLDCAQQVFATHLLQLNELNKLNSDTPEELLDESTIENYVHERNILGNDVYHDLSEL